jgi:hypothetical protein
MKRFFSILLTSILLLPSSILVYSQDENYDAVYLQLKKEYTLNPDGSWDYRYVKKQKLQTYRSFHNLYGETFIVYNPDFQSLKVNEVYTIMADGRKNPSPANAFNEVLPGVAANAPAYNKLREMVITHSGTERNAILNLDYVLHSAKSAFFPSFIGNEILAENEPIKELTLVIRVPIKDKLKYLLLNSPVIPVVTQEGALQVFTWKFTNVPAISPEDFQKGGNDLYPRIIFSPDINRNELYNAFMAQSAFYKIPGLNEEMKQMVAGLSSQNKEKSDLILKLQEKVINELRLYPVPFKYTDLFIRTPQETWNSNGGTPIEKAALLAALLKEAGVNASPVLMIRNSLYNESIGTMSDIEDFLVKAELPGSGPVYLSVTTLNPQNLFYVFPERAFVELGRNDAGIADIHVEKSSFLKNKINLAGTFTIDLKNQLSGEISFTETNGTNPYLMLLRDKNKAKSLIGGGLSSADLKDPGITKMGMDQSSVVIAVQKDKAFRSDSDYYFLQLPLITNGIESMGIHLLPRDRNTPLEIPSIIEENYDFTYVIPEKMKTFIPKEIKEIKNDVGSFLFEVKTEGKKVVVHKSLKLEKRLIQPAEYPEFKALMDHWNADRYRGVVLVK